MYIDTDMAMDPDIETFILMGACSNLFHTIQVNGWECPSLASLLVPLPAILSCRCKNTCDPSMPKISKITKEETEQLTELV